MFQKSSNKFSPLYSYSILEPLYSLYPLSELHNRYVLVGLARTKYSNLFNNDDLFWNKLKFQDCP